MKNKGCSCWVLIRNTGDGGLFIFSFCHRFFFNVLPFPPSTDKLYKVISMSIGDAQRTVRCAYFFILLGGRWRCRGDRDGEGDEGRRIYRDKQCKLELNKFTHAPIY